MEREIVFKFLQLRPDIAGFVEEQHMKSLITVEVKEKSLTLEDIYQAKLYKEVFEAKYGFLVTLSPIQEELKRLCKGNFDILRSAADGVYRFLAIARFNNASGEFSDWFEENPFEQPRYWKRCIPVVPSAARDLRGAIFFIDGQARSAAGVGDVDREQPGAVALAAHHFECFAA